VRWEQERRHEGISVRHADGCGARIDERCTCSPTYRAEVYSKRDAKKIRRSFRTLAEARTWRADAIRGARTGTLRSPSAATIGVAAETLTTGMRRGSVLNRSGDPYKPRVISNYEAALDQRVLPFFGPGARLTDITRRDVQRLADELVASGLDPSTVRNAVMPLRVLFRHAIEEELVDVNPTVGLRLPAVRGRRDRIAAPVEAERLIAALRVTDRALWGCAIYAGLRRGEIAALRWEDVDLAGGVIDVSRAWDDHNHVFVEPKTRAATRRIPIAAHLRDLLIEHRQITRRGTGLIVGATPDRPFTASAVRRRALTDWRTAGLKPIALHECRHTFASLMIAAGVNAKALTTFLGHASIETTFDLYGKLMPGGEAEAAARLDAYLADASERARAADGAPLALFTI
jgi:integrase